MTMARRIAITGAAGFIGANLVRAAVDRGYDVCAIVRATTDLARLRDVRPQIELATADICDYAVVSAVLASFQPDIVIHAAMSGGHASGADDRLESLRTSVIGTATVLEAAAAARVQRVVHLGSFLVYASAPEPHREDEPPRPSTVRGTAKALAAAWCAQFAAVTGVPILELRLFSVYGPLEGAHRLIPTLLAAAANDTQVPLRRGPRHDWVFVDDVVDACLRACCVEPFPRGVINIGSGLQCSNEEVAAAVERVTGAHVRLIQGGHPGSPADADACLADVNQARDLLGWVPTHSLDEGLAATLRWLRSRQEMHV
jgi:nucleoside-diphosphate-sugar epimerase